MLARRDSLAAFNSWNHEHGAPYGHSPGCAFSPLASLTEHELRRRGPFAVQPNNSTREFEYPWAYHAAHIASGLKILEIGGGLSGFQFVLGQSGCAVVNVDPGMGSGCFGEGCDETSIQKMNASFGTRVELRRCTIEHANLTPEAYDRAFSISVLEHLPDKEAADVMKGVHACLKPGGLFVLTVDLFLDLAPFTPRQINQFGKNVDLSYLSAVAPFERVIGRADELHGFREFARDAILRERDRFVLGRFHPVLVQCLVLRKKE